MASTVTQVSPEAVRAHYEELDAFYRDVWGEHLHHGLWETGRETPETAVRQLVRYVARRARIRPGDEVLDVGCGYGATARQLASRYGARVTALTLSPAQYRFARDPLHGENGGVRFVLADWLRFSPDAGRYDVALAVESLEHMADPALALRKIHDALRPGGRAVICAWTASDSPEPWERRRLLEPICREGRLAALRTAPEIEEQLCESRLQVVMREDLTIRVAPTWSHGMARLGWRLLSNPDYLRYLMNAHSSQRGFLLTPLRIWWAYRRGALRYTLIVARRPDESAPRQGRGAAGRN